RDAQDRSAVRGLEPAPSASHGAVQRAHEHDVDHGVKGAGREFLGAGEDVPGSIIDKNVQRAGGPDSVHRLLDRFQAANVAGMGVDRAFRRELSSRGFQNFFAAPTDVYDGAQFQKTSGHAFAQTGAAAGDDNAL